MFVLQDKNKEGKYSIVLKYYVPGESVPLSLSLRVKIFKKDWNSKTKNVKKVSGNALTNELRYINKLVGQYKATLINYEIDCKEKGVRRTKEGARNWINTNIKGKGRKKNNLTIIDLFREYIKTKDLEKANPRTTRKYRSTLNLIIEYVGNKKYYLEDITIDFYHGFLKFSWEVKKHNDNHLGRNIGFIRTVMEWGKKKKYHDNNIYLEFKQMSYEPDNVALSKRDVAKLERAVFNTEEMERIRLECESEYQLYIENKDFDKRRAAAKKLMTRVTSPDLATKVRDIFLIGIYSGQRLSDYSVFEKADVRDGMILKRAKKSDTQSYIPLHSRLEDLLDKYDWQLPKIPEPTFNRVKKVICRYVGFTEDVKIRKRVSGERIHEIYKRYELISSHTARRTFVTISLASGMQRKVVKVITGIKSDVTLEKYNKLAEQTAKDEIDRIWG